MKISTRPSSDTGRKATEASANRMTRPDHFALVIFCTAAKATLPPARPVKYSQLTWKSCQARGAASLRQGHDEEDQSQDGEPAPDAQEEIVLAGQGALDQPLVDGSRAHRGLAEVEPVALGAGGMPTAAPAGSCGAGLAPWSFRRWLTMAQRSEGR